MTTANDTRCLVPLQIMDAIQKAHDGKPVEKITKSRPPCVIL